MCQDLLCDLVSEVILVLAVDVRNTMPSRPIRSVVLGPVLVLVLVLVGQLLDQSLEFQLAILDGGEQSPDLGGALPRQPELEQAAQPPLIGVHLEKDENGLVIQG